jgi:hypothetical protein
LNPNFIQSKAVEAVGLERPNFYLEENSMSNSDTPVPNQTEIIATLQALRPQLEKGLRFGGLFYFICIGCLVAAGPLLFGRAEDGGRALLGYFLLWISIFGLVISVDIKQRRLMAVLYRALVELYASRTN